MRVPIRVTTYRLDPGIVELVATATLAGRSVGTATMKVGRSDSWVMGEARALSDNTVDDESTIALVEDVRVEPAARHGGLGSRLVRALVKQAWRLGASSVWLAAMPYYDGEAMPSDVEMVRARAALYAFYEAIGFRRWRDGTGVMVLRGSAKRGGSR